MSDCVYCDRECPRCCYPIDGGMEHIEQPQASTSNVVVCSLRRVVRPFADAMNLWVTHDGHKLRAALPRSRNED